MSTIINTRTNPAISQGRCRANGWRGKCVRNFRYSGCSIKNDLLPEVTQPVSKILPYVVIYAFEPDLAFRDFYHFLSKFCFISCINR